VKSEFSRADLNLMLDIIHSSIKCRDVSDFDNLLNHIKMVFPFTYARCGFGDSSEFEEKGFEQACKMFSKFPIEWETRYNKKNYVLKDSVALSLEHKKGAIYWSDCINFIGADKTENSESFKILDEAAVFGLQAGWIYSDQERRPSDCTIISFAGDDIKKSRRFEMILEHLGPHISQAIRNIILDWDRGFNSRPFSGIFSRPMSRVSAQPLIF
jgi:hypothetical protein